MNDLGLRCSAMPVADADIGARWGRGRNTLLAALPAAERERLWPHLEPVALGPSFLLPAELALSHAYFPLQGLVSLRAPTGDGATVQVGVVGRAGILGASLLLEANDPPFEMLGLVAGEAVRMPADDFARCAAQLPVLRRRLMRYTLAQLHETARTAACIGLHSVEQRLALWLLLCCDRLGSSSLPITHESLAQMLGVTRPFVTRVAGALEEAGLIQHQRGVLRIVDAAGLETRACEDYRAIQHTYASLLG